MAAAPVSPPDGQRDFFAVFGLKRRFGIDRAALERKFYELSRASHPDRFTASGPLARAEALERMSAINEAYGVLKDPAGLRQHYLRLEGLESLEGAPSQAAPGSAGAAGIPLELAESWFEMQDAVSEDPGSAGDRIAAFERELAGLRSQAAERLAALERSIDEGADAQGAAPRELLERLAGEIRAQSYLKSMERDVERIRNRLLA